MFALVPVVIAIALTGILVATSISILNVDKAVEQTIRDSIAQQTQALKTAWRRHADDNARTFTCIAPLDGGGCDGRSEAFDTASLLPQASWQADLEPEYSFIPPGYEGMTWSYFNDGTTFYFCLSGPIASPIMKTALEAIDNDVRFGSNEVTVSPTCGSTSSSAITSTAAVTVFLTTG